MGSGAGGERARCGAGMAVVVRMMLLHSGQPLRQGKIIPFWEEVRALWPSSRGPEGLSGLN